jgi:hypothetical protein
MVAHQVPKTSMVVLTLGLATKKHLFFRWVSCLADHSGRNLGWDSASKISLVLRWAGEKVMGMEMFGCQLGIVNMDGCSLGGRDKASSPLDCAANYGF